MYQCLTESMQLRVVRGSGRRICQRRGEVAHGGVGGIVWSVELRGAMGNISMHTVFYWNKNRGTFNQQN